MFLVFCQNVQVDLGIAVQRACENQTQSLNFLYPLDFSIKEKIEAIAKSYGASGVEYSEQVFHNCIKFHKKHFMIDKSIISSAVAWLLTLILSTLFTSPITIDANALMLYYHKLPSLKTNQIMDDLLFFFFSSLDVNI